MIRLIHGLDSEQTTELRCVVCGVQHQIEMHDMKVEDLLGEDAAGEYDHGNIPCNLLTVAATGNSSFLEDLLKVGMDPDVGDSKGRTALVRLVLGPLDQKNTFKLSNLDLNPKFESNLIIWALFLSAYSGIEGVRGLRAGSPQASVQRKHQR